MAAMHYTVMVERSSVKVFFTILVLHIFYFLQSEYIKKLQNRKAKNILYLPYICSTLKKIMTTSLLLIRVRIK